MKILLITTLYPGYENQDRSETSYAIHYFAREWKKKGNEVQVIRPWVGYSSIFNITKKGSKKNKRGFDDKILMDDVTVNRFLINKFPKIDFSKKEINNLFLKASEIIKNGYNPDVILCHMINPSLYIGAKLKEKYKIPLALIMHNTDVVSTLKNRRKLSKFNEAKYLIDKIGFRSLKIKKEYNKIFNNNAVAEENQFIVNSGIEKKYIIDDEELENKINRKIKTIFVASNLIPLKKIDTLVSSFIKLNNKNLKLEIAGDGDIKEKLVLIAKSSKLKDNIIFLGRLSREEVMKKMRESEIFAMVSSPETFGLVYLEAMASGCITIGSKGEGIDGVIEDGKNGFLCKPGSSEELTKILNKIINMNYEEKERIIRNAVDTTKEMTQEKMAERYLEEIKTYN